MELIIENEQDIFSDITAIEALITQAVKVCLEAENVSTDLEISVLLVDNKGIHEINAEFRDMDKPTDVLSFPQFNSKEEIAKAGYCALGDMVLSLEMAQAQACEYNHSFEREVGFLTVHSMLHMLGYDHDTDMHTEEMQARERAIMEQLKLMRE